MKTAKELFEEESKREYIRNDRGVAPEYNAGDS
jgi:hypothetical protein